MNPPSNGGENPAGCFGAEHQLTKRVDGFVAAGDDTDHKKFARIGFNFGWLGFQPFSGIRF
jgi:hypothetical protein